MFQFRSFSILFKLSDFLESILTPKAFVKLILNGVDHYQSLESHVKDRLAIWKADGLPEITLQDYATSAMLEFIVFKNQVEIGKAKSIIKIGQNRKDCLDLATENFQIVGKFLFEVVWTSNKRVKDIKSSQDPSEKEIYPQLVANKKEGVNPYYRESTVSIAQNQYSQQMPQKQILKQELKDSDKPIIIEKNKKKSKEKKEKLGMGSMFCCFGPGYKRQKTNDVTFAFAPYEMKEEDLSYAAPKDMISFEVQYYSKRFADKYRH